MGNMNVTDVGALFGSLSITSQAAIVGRISNTVSPMPMTHFLVILLSISNGCKNTKKPILKWLETVAFLGYIQNKNGITL